MTRSPRTPNPTAAPAMMLQMSGLRHIERASTRQRKRKNERHAVASTLATAAPSDPSLPEIDDLHAAIDGTGRIGGVEQHLLTAADRIESACVDAVVPHEVVADGFGPALRQREIMARLPGRVGMAFEQEVVRRKLLRLNRDGDLLYDVFGIV